MKKAIIDLANHGANFKLWIIFPKQFLKFIKKDEETFWWLFWVIWIWLANIGLLYLLFLLLWLENVERFLKFIYVFSFLFFGFANHSEFLNSSRMMNKAVSDLANHDENIGLGWSSSNNCLNSSWKMKETVSDIFGSFGSYKLYSFFLCWALVGNCSNFRHVFLFLYTNFAYHGDILDLEMILLKQLLESIKKDEKGGWIL